MTLKCPVCKSYFRKISTLHGLYECSTKECNALLQWYKPLKKVKAIQQTLNEKRKS